MNSIGPIRDFTQTMLEQITFEAHKLKCKIEAESSLVEAIKNDQFTYHYMMGARLGDEYAPDIRVIQDDNIRKPVVINYPEVRFRTGLSPRDVVVLGEYLLERARQEKGGLYAVSSACASLGDLAVVFYGGATNLGKTSSMLTLIKKCNFDFVSDEKTLLGLSNKVVEGGSISVPTRKKIIRERFFQPDQEELPEFVDFRLAEGTKKAGLVVYPHLDHGLKQPIFYKWKPLDFFWLLTRDLSQEIRGGIRLVNNFNYLLPSLDNEELTQSRVGRTRSFCDVVPSYYFQGSLDQVAEYIPRILEEENAGK